MICLSEVLLPVSWWSLDWTHKPSPSCIAEIILTGCISVWNGSYSAHNRKALQRVVGTADNITGNKLLDRQDISWSQCLRKAHKIISVPQPAVYYKVFRAFSHRQDDYRTAFTCSLSNITWNMSLFIFHFSLCHLDTSQMNILTLTQTLYTWTL